MSGPSRVIVGLLTGPFGVRGEMKCRPTAQGDGAFAAGRSFALGPDSDARELRCTGVRRHHEKLLLSFDTITSPEAARTYVGTQLFAEPAEVRLAPDEYFDADLVGLELVDEDGRPLGNVVAVQHFPAQDCLVVGPSRSLVPLLKAFVKKIDLQARTIVTTLPPGLIE